MRTKDAIPFLERALAEAREAGGRDGAWSVEIEAESNIESEPVVVTFNNDDMERDDMTGRTIVDFD
jgi:hypothetical protein